MKLRPINRWILGSILAFASIFLLGDGLSPHPSRSLQVSWNLGHVAYFFIFGLLLLQSPFFKNQSYWRQCLYLFISAFIVGVFIEYLQYGSQRQTDWLDVKRDVLGALLALAVAHTSLAITWRQKLFNGFVLAAFILSLWPLTKALIDEYHLHQQFPVLADFSKPFEATRWSSSAGHTISPTPTGEPALKVTFDTRRYANLDLKYFKHDWQSFKSLNLVIFNPSDEPLSINLRVHDLAHESNYRHNDRYNQRILLNSGWNQITRSIDAIQQAPTGRSMDMNKVVNLKLFSINLNSNRTLYLTSVFLAR